LSLAVGVGGLGPHCAKFEDLDHPVAEAVAVLAKEHRASTIEFDHGGNHDQ
jgi:hypothetical protein